MGLIAAAWTLINTSSGCLIWGTGNVARPYSEGLQNLESAIARMVVGIDAMLSVVLSRMYSTRGVIGFDSVWFVLGWVGVCEFCECHRATGKAFEGGVSYIDKKQLLRRVTWWYINTAIFGITATRCNCGSGQPFQFNRGGFFSSSYWLLTGKLAAVVVFFQRRF